MKTRFILLAVVVLAGVGAWQAYSRGWLPTWVQARLAPAAESTAASQPGRRGGGRRARPEGPIPVLATAAQHANVPVTIDAVGTIQALNSVTVRTQVDGRLMSLAFKDGQDVKKDDVLAKIDPATYQAQYDQAVAKKAQDEALLANARVDLDRYSRLADAQYGSRQQADTQKSLVLQYEAQVRADQGAIDNAKVSLDRTTITSPIEGRTGIRLVDAGNILHASDSTGIVVVAQLQPIAMIFNLPQQYLGQANAAMSKGAVKVEALDSDNATVLATGTVDVIDNQVDSTTGTVRIKARFANDERHLWPGQFVNVRLYVDTIADAIVVPTAAVQRGPAGAYVYTLNEDDTVKLTPVVLGRQDETRSVIKTGVVPPTQVITTGFARLTDGAHVVVTPAGAAAPNTAATADAGPPTGTLPATAPATAPADQAATEGNPGKRHRRARQQSEAQTDSNR